MRREELFDILGQIDDRFIIPARRERRSIPWQNYVGVAAALCVIVTGVWVLVHMGSSGITLLPGNPTDPTSAITAPSTDPTQPSETTVPTTLPQETQPYYSELMVFLYEGKQPFQSVTVDVSQCQLDHLYYYYEKSGEVVPICDEPVACYGDNPSGFYFVKKAEPNKIYSAPLTNLAEQFVLNTSDFGPVCEIYAGDIGADANVLMLTVDNKRGVLLDLASGETEVFIQQYYIEDTIIGDLLKTDGKWTYNKIWFRGKLHEEDTLKDYFYWIDSDSITENNN